MISADDVEFHPVPSENSASWTETNYFPFIIPEVGIAGCVYNVFRPGLGVGMSDITIIDRFARTWEGQAYVDNQQHLPCPERLSRYQLTNGVSVEVLSAPRDYLVHYTGIDDTELRFEFRGVMRPQDFNDPDEDPITRRHHDAAGATGWDQAFNGHFDMTGRAVGELVLRGKRYAIDCLSTMDHSWGPRKERDNSNAVVAQAYFDDDLAIHVLAGFDPRKADAIGPVYHGYVWRDGAVRGLVGGSGRVQRIGMVATIISLELEDEAGDRYNLLGSPVNWAPWAPYPSIIYYQGLNCWRLDGRVGHGPYQEIVSRAFITRHSLSD